MVEELASPGSGQRHQIVVSGQHEDHEDFSECHAISVIVRFNPICLKNGWAQGVFASSELAPFELGVSPGMEVSKPSIGNE